MGGVHSKYLLGGVESTINDTTKAALTAFVTLVIMKSGVGSTDPSDPSIVSVSSSMY